MLDVYLRCDGSIQSDAIPFLIESLKALEWKLFKIYEICEIGKFPQKFPTVPFQTYALNTNNVTHFIQIIVAIPI
jgi:hypothetical protein